MEVRVLLDNDFNSKELSEYTTCIEDLIYNEQVQLMKEYPHHRKVSCLEHSVRVSLYTYRICKALKLNKHEAARGALLHDLFLYDWHKVTLEKGLHGFEHPRIALENARKITILSELEEDIIEKHMFPLTIKPPKYLESLIVCLVDKYVALLECLGLV